MKCESCGKSLPVGTIAYEQEWGTISVKGTTVTQGTRKVIVCGDCANG